MIICLFFYKFGNYCNNIPLYRIIFVIHSRFHKYRSGIIPKEIQITKPNMSNISYEVVSAI